jgi:Ala-tRNA(Pro) deacylase
MPLSGRLQNFLDSCHASYCLTTHRSAYTANQVASAEHLPAREVAKSVVVVADQHYYIIAVPANRHVDLREVRAALRAHHVRLATETEMADLFPDCEVGANPPVGKAYGMPVLLDAELAVQPRLTFNAGTHRECLHMDTREFRELTHPEVAALTREEPMGLVW